MARAMLISMLLATTVCFLFNISICQETPGIRVLITKRGLNYVNEFCLNKIYQEWRSYNFPTYSKADTLLLNVQISDFSKPTGDVSLVPGIGLVWSVEIQRYKFSVDVKYSTKIFWVNVGKTISLTMDVRSLSLHLPLEATKSSNGGLSLNVVNCDSVANVQVSSNNIILKVTLSFLRRKLKSIIQKKLCDSAVNIINKVTPTLSNFTLTRTIRDSYVFDYRIVSDPVFTPTYMQTNHKAAVMIMHPRSNFPFSPNPLPNVNETKNMIYFIISDFVFNTWLYTAHRDGKLLFKLTKEKFKTQKQREMLRTNCHESICIGTFFPQIARDHPNRPIELIFVTFMPPTIKFTPNNIHLDVNVMLKFSIIRADGKSVIFLSTHLVLLSELKTKITGLNVLYTITNTTLNLERSLFNLPGNPNNVLLEKFVNSVVQFVQGILPGVNFPLTVPSNTMLKNTKLEIVQNALIVSSDLAISSI